MPANDQAVQKGMLKLGGARDAHARNAPRSQVLEDSEAGAMSLATWHVGLDEMTSLLTGGFLPEH